MSTSKGFKIQRRTLDAFGEADRSLRGKWHADSENHGFYAIAYSSGEIAFAARYRVNGRRRTVRLGHYPAVTPEVARKEALGVLGGAARGQDEAEKRKAARDETRSAAKRITFGKWRCEYVASAARHLKSTRDPERYLSMAGKEWDTRPLAEVTTRDVETLRNRIANSAFSKSAKGGATQANRWLANVRAAFSHAVRLGHLERNAAALVRLLPENPPRMRTLTPDEEKRLREAVVKHEDPFVRVAFTLLLDTGA